MSREMAPEECVKFSIKMLEVAQGVAQDGTTSTCETGDVYETLCWTPDGNFTKQEGGECAIFETEDLAWLVWLAAFTIYIENLHGKVHWRTRPVMTKPIRDGIDGYAMRGYSVYARVFIEKEKLVC